jgi:hypothetical protein
LAVPRCTKSTYIKWAEIKPGMMLHLVGASTCREFLVTGDKKLDPVMGREGWQVMEMGDKPMVAGAEKPFTGVVMILAHGVNAAWHPAAS